MCRENHHALVSRMHGSRVGGRLTVPHASAISFTLVEDRATSCCVDLARTWTTGASHINRFRSLSASCSSVGTGPCRRFVDVARSHRGRSGVLRRVVEQSRRRHVPSRMVRLQVSMSCRCWSRACGLLTPSHHHQPSKKRIVLGLFQLS